MPWNWQQPDWPSFSWRKPRIVPAEQHFLRGGGVLAGSVLHLSDEEQGELTIELMSTEAVTTSEIEGEVLDRASVQSSIRRELGLAVGGPRATPAEKGIAEVTVNLYRTIFEPLTEEALFSWHRRLFSGRPGFPDIGCYRSGSGPMQVVSGAPHARKVHFEAPPSSCIANEMKRFLNWFERTAPHGPEELPALTRAGISHLYFESIHPFEDGNGRIGRAIAEKALAQGMGQANVTGLAATILARRKSYYAALEAASRSNEITDWLAWFAGTAIEAQQNTMALIEFLIDKARHFQRLKGNLNARQEKALLRMFREGPQGFEGGLSARNYGNITDASPATTTRDLADLVEKGALIRTGERKNTRYQLAVRLRPVRRVVIDGQGRISDGEAGEP